MAPASNPALLGDGLLCIYKQYKADTETIAGWLKATAVKHGYKFDGQDGTSIRTSDFIPMAEQIVADVKHTRFSLVPAIQQAFRRAIFSRKECTAWYEQNTEGQWESNEKHAYFTGILNTTWQILRSAADLSDQHPSSQQPTRKKGRPKPRTAVAENKIFVPSNRFAAVYIDAGGDEEKDEPDFAAAQDVASTHTPAKGKKYKSLYVATPAKITPDEGQIEEEFWFAIQSFLQEQHRVRQEVKRYWQDYKDDESNLVMATFGTRMAIDLIRRSEIELSLQINRPARFPEDKYPVSTFPALLVGAKQQGKQPCSAPLDGFAPVSRHLNELTLYNTYSTLRSWWHYLMDDDSYTVNEGTFSRKEVTRLLDRISWVDPTASQRLPYEDDITRGIKEALQRREVPIWTSFALRLLLDMEDVLGNCELMPWGDASQDTLMHAETPLTHWHHQWGSRHTPLDEEAWGECYPTDRSVDNDPSLISKPTATLEKPRSSKGPRKKARAKKRTAKSKSSKDASVDEETEPCTCDACLRCGYDRYERNAKRALEWVRRVEENPMSRLPYLADPIRRNPLHCGLIKYDLYRSRQMSALCQNTYHNCDIWTMMFIYAAGRSAFPDSLAWPDMEFLLYQQGEKHVFFGGRPKNIEWTARKWLLALGRSSSDYSYKDLGHVKCCSSRFLINYKKWRPLKDNSVLGGFVSSRMHCCDIHHAMEQDNFMEMIRKMHTPDALSRLARMLDMSQDEAADFVANWTSRLHSWTLKDILELTQMYLAVDLADIGFDWPALDSTCSEMWRDAFPVLKIKNTDGEDHGDIHCDHDDCNVGTQPSTWTTMILSQAAEVEIRLSDKKKKDPAVSSDELQKGSPAFMKLWSLIQAHCRRRVNTALGHGIFTSFAAEECLIKLLDTRNEKPYPARVVAPHVQRCFKGYPEDLAKQSSSMILAKNVMASDPGGLRNGEKIKGGM